MIKVMAVLRTIFLVFIIGYTVRATPLFTNVSKTFDEQYARASEAVGLLARAAWLAVAWIALETAIGWWMATRQKKLVKDQPSPNSAEPPFAPPR